MLCFALQVLGDWNSGRIPFYTLPPSRGNEEHASAAVVAAFGADFNIDEMNSAVIAGEELRSLADEPEAFAELPAGAAAATDLAAMEADDAAAAAADAAEDEARSVSRRSKGETPPAAAREKPRRPRRGRNPAGHCEGENPPAAARDPGHCYARCCSAPEGGRGISLRARDDNARLLLRFVRVTDARLLIGEGWRCAEGVPLGSPA